MRKLLVIIKCLFIIGVLVAVFIEIGVIRFGVKAKPKKSDCIIVLGCQVKGTYPSPFLQSRLKEGIRLYKEGYGKYIIVSGGKGPGEDITEAQAMKKFLMGYGIKESVIIMEDKSKNTKENLIFSKSIMKEKGFKNAIVVSNKYHLKRASLMCKSLEIEASYSGVFVSDRKLTEIKGHIREVPGIIRYLILGE